MAGVTVWHVDSGIHGSIYTTGSAAFTIIGPTRLSLRLRGDLNANVQLSVDGFAKWEHDVLSIHLTPDIGLPGSSIPDVLTIGSYLIVDLVAKIKPMLTLHGTWQTFHWGSRFDPKQPTTRASCS